IFRFLTKRSRVFLMKTCPHIFAIHFSVIAFELFYPPFPCLSEKLVALASCLHWFADKMSALRSSFSP
ncbi:MAG: hypothetical protein ONA90_08250, partial [candidate division KSB1 bacterium]|nr:hypothetical protein [candidate division KSB1 bacterium]